jgi:hypothetical protein
MWSSVIFESSGQIDILIKKLMIALELTESLMGTNIEVAKATPFIITG